MVPKGDDDRKSHLSFPKMSKTQHRDTAFIYSGLSLKVFYLTTYFAVPVDMSCLI